MDEASSRDEWGRFSLLLATIINSNPFRSGAAVNASDINPYHDEKQDKRTPLVTLTGSELALRFNGCIN